MRLESYQFNMPRYENSFEDTILYQSFQPSNFPNLLRTLLALFMMDVLSLKSLKDISLSGHYRQLDDMLCGGRVKRAVL